jgi:hypothetical protein
VRSFEVGTIHPVGVDQTTEQETHQQPELELNDLLASYPIDAPGRRCCGDFCEIVLDRLPPSMSSVRRFDTEASILARASSM